MPTARPTLDSERWRTLSPLLDQALDLDAAERERWLQQVMATDASLAADLRAVLAQGASADHSDFLENGPPPRVFWDNNATLANLHIGAYTLRSPIGQGGMGSVWLAERTDGQFEGQAAVKLLNLALVGKATAERFRREGAILARLSHPSIARLLDAGLSSTGQPYLVLEHVHGEHIDDYCRTRGLDERARVRLFMHVLAGVANAHAQLVIHRDIKPSNVLVSADGQVKLLDFGIATFLEQDTESGLFASVAADDLTRAAGHAHTLNYASPEQIRRERVGTASDIFSLGALLYGLLADRPAYRAVRGTAAEREEAILAGLVLPLNQSDNKTSFRISRDLESITLKAMSLKAADRYDSVTGLRDDLERFLDARPVSARGRARGYLAFNFVRRHWLALSGAVIAFTAVSVAAFLIWSESETLRRTKAFLIEALTPTGYYTDGSGLLTQRELLMRAADGIPAKFADEPKAAGELYQAIGESLFNMGEQQDALTVRNRAQPLVDAVRGRSSIEAVRNASRVTYLYFTLRRTPEFLAAMEDLKDRCNYSDDGTPSPQCYAIERMQSQHRSLMGQSRLSTARWEQVDARVTPRLKGDDLWQVQVNYWGALAATNVAEMERAKAHWARLLALPRVQQHARGDHQYALAIARALGEAGFVGEAAELSRTVYQQGIDYLGQGFDARLFYVPGVANLQSASGKFFDTESLLRTGIEKTNALATPEARQESAESRAALGLMLIAQRRFDEARPWLDEALALQNARHDGHNENAVRIRLQLATLMAISGDIAGAEAATSAVRAQCEREGDMSGLVRANALLGAISRDPASRDAAWNRAVAAMEKNSARFPDIQVLLRTLNSNRAMPPPREDATVAAMRTYAKKVLDETARAISQQRPRGL